MIIDTLPSPVEAGDSCTWFSDRCHGFTHGLATVCDTRRKGKLLYSCVAHTTITAEP